MTWCFCTKPSANTMLTNTKLHIEEFPVVSGLIIWQLFHNKRIIIIISVQYNFILSNWKLIFYCMHLLKSNFMIIDTPLLPHKFSADLYLERLLWGYRVRHCCIKARTKISGEKYLTSLSASGCCSDTANRRKHCSPILLTWRDSSTDWVVTMVF